MAMKVEATSDRTVLTSTARLVDGWIGGGELLGAQVHVATAEGPVAELAGGCREPGRPATTEDIGRIYCAAKPLTTVCIARAVDRGALDLDDPVSRFLPVRDDARRQAMTVRSVLTHSSGFPPTRQTTYAERVRSAIERDVPSWLWAAEPSYDNTLGWHLLAEIVRVVYGRPIDDVVRDEIGVPLDRPGLVLTRPPHPERYAPLYKRLAPHQFVPATPATPPELLFTELDPAHGGAATAADLAALMSELLRCVQGRGRLLGPATTVELVGARNPVRMGPGLRTARWGTGLEVDLAADSLGGDWSPQTFGHRGAAPLRTVVLAFADPLRGVAGAIRLYSIDARSNWRVWKIGAAISDDVHVLGG